MQGGGRFHLLVTGLLLAVLVALATLVVLRNLRKEDLRQRAMVEAALSRLLDQRVRVGNLRMLDDTSAQLSNLRIGERDDQWLHASVVSASFTYDPGERVLYLTHVDLRQARLALTPSRIGAMRRAVGHARAASAADQEPRYILERAVIDAEHVSLDVPHGVLTVAPLLLRFREGERPGLFNLHGDMPPGAELAMEGPWGRLRLEGEGRADYARLDGDHGAARCIIDMGLKEKEIAPCDDSVAALLWSIPAGLPLTATLQAWHDSHALQVQELECSIADRLHLALAGVVDASGGAPLTRLTLQPRRPAYADPSLFMRKWPLARARVDLHSGLLRIPDIERDLSWSWSGVYSLAMPGEVTHATGRITRDLRADARGVLGPNAWDVQLDMTAANLALSPTIPNATLTVPPLLYEAPTASLHARRMAAERHWSLDAQALFVRAGEQHVLSATSDGGAYPVVRVDLGRPLTFTASIQPIAQGWRLTDLAGMARPDELAEHLPAWPRAQWRWPEALEWHDGQMTLEPGPGRWTGQGLALASHHSATGTLSWSVTPPEAWVRLDHGQADARWLLRHLPQWPHDATGALEFDARWLRDPHGAWSMEGDVGLRDLTLALDDELILEGVGGALPVNQRRTHRLHVERLRVRDMELATCTADASLQGATLTIQAATGTWSGVSTVTSGYMVLSSTAPAHDLTTRTQPLAPEMLGPPLLRRSLAEFPASTELVRLERVDRRDAGSGPKTTTALLGPEETLRKVEKYIIDHFGGDDFAGVSDRDVDVLQERMLIFVD